mmetsp:Transcript_26185/g.36159  ORF Transcript_26185/g.36159 Transcript_26185/m.36159 type:complete len:97 (-) Transcript_26185:371-661(-)
MHIPHRDLAFRPLLPRQFVIPSVNFDPPFDMKAHTLGDVLDGQVGLFVPKLELKPVSDIRLGSPTDCERSPGHPTATGELLQCDVPPNIANDVQAV